MDRRAADPEDFPGQFLISRDGDSRLDHWPARRLGGWLLQHCPTLPLASLVDARGEVVGWLLGYPIMDGGQVAADSVSVPAPENDVTFADRLESTVAALAGRFAVVALGGGIERVYLDPAGQLPVVYAPSQGRVGASLRLVRNAAAPEDPLEGVLDVRGRGQFYPFGLTPDRAVGRLLPNHFLELSDFSCHRHWPRDGAMAGEGQGNPESTVVSLARKLRDNVGAMAEAFPLQMSLTAGRDSRTLLAAARPYAREVMFFTTAIPDAVAQLDCHVAEALAGRFSLSHRILPWQAPEPDELEAWQRRVGHCVAGRTWHSVRTLRQLDPDRVFLPGTCAEVGRAYYWRRADLERDGLGPDEALARLGLPRSPILVEAARGWLAELPASRRTEILDLLYLEQRLGCWAGPAQLGHLQATRVMPFADRRVFSLMFRLPPDYRYRQRLPRDLIRVLWPDLDRLPFNREPGVRGAVGEARRRVVSRLARVPGSRATKRRGA